MKPVLIGIEHVFDLIEHFFENISALFLAGFAVTAMLQVLTRFVFKAPLPWSEEGARYLFIFMLFSGCIVGVRRKSHYCLDMFVGRFGLGPRKAFSIVSGVIQFAFFCFLSHTSYIFMGQMNGRTSPVLHLPMGVPYSAIVIFSVFGVLFTVEGLFKTILPGLFDMHDKVSGGGDYV